MTHPSQAQTAALAWDWSHLALGVTFALPAVVVFLLNPQAGLALGVGVLPVAAVGLPARRRQRVQGLIVAAVAAVGLLVGSVLGQHAVVAVIGMFGISLIASLAASRSRLGLLALTLAVPLVGLGLSFDDPATVVGAAVLIMLSGAYAVAVSMLWPERPPPTRPPAPPLSRDEAIDYGIRLGLAAATAAAIGFWFDLDHKGWLCGAALLVMRPAREVLVARSLGRAASVLVGGLAASAIVLAQPATVPLEVVLGAAVALLTATTGSRWYVTPAFTTFVVFLLLLYDHPGDTTWRFVQRTVETFGGVGIALLFGLVVPLARRRLRASRE